NLVVLNFREKACHISNYSNLNILRQIWNVMSIAEQVLIRKSAIGHLIDMPDDKLWADPCRIGENRVR
ncbi:hypothetical protein MKW98_019094, partial [Papaver atlanticum]